jgi:hypothetical protein
MARAYARTIVVGRRAIHSRAWCRGTVAPLKRLAVLTLISFATPASAAKHPRFEPTDLELEDAGTAELDLQLGAVRGQDAWRTVIPDFELDLGVSSTVEIDLDGAYALDGDRNQLPDDLWPSVKLGIAERHAWAIGVQAGPKLPVAPDSHGVGIEGLALFGHVAGRLQVVLDVGALVDPHTGSSARPAGGEAGLDVEIELVPHAWSVLGELGGVHYVSADPDQLDATAGVQYSPTPHIDLSLVVLVGLASGSDRYGVLFGISPKLRLW